MKLRTKVPLILVPLIVLSLLGLGWFAYVQFRDSTEQLIFGEMRLVLGHLVEHMESVTNTANGNVELLSRQSLVQKYLLTDNENERYSLLQPPLLRMFTAYQEAFPGYYELRVFLPDGYEDVRLTRPYIENIDEEEGDSALFRALQSNEDDVYTTLFLNPDNNETSLFAGKRVSLANLTVDPVGSPPTLRGYVGVTIDMSVLKSFVGDHVISNSGYLFVTDTSGNIVFESRRNPVGDVIPGDIIESVRLNEQRYGQPLRTKFGGKSDYIAMVDLPVDLHAFAVLPESELRGATYKLAIAVASITLLTIVVTIMSIIFVIEHQVIQPINRLRELARQIGSGNLAVSISRSGRNDEISELTTAFVDMAGNLEQSNERIQYLAYHDSLTGLPNRAMFKKYLEHTISQSQRNDTMLAILFLDLDDFKQINDTMGHQAGDTLLQEISERLGNALRGSDYIANNTNPCKPDEALARLGGDEFIMLLPDIQDKLAPGIVAERIIDLIKQPVVINKHHCHVSASIGVTLYPDDGSTADELIKNADIAMYHAKDTGKNAYEYFESSMNIATQERVKLEKKLRHALENDLLELHYQPQVDATTQQITGFEALLRWNDPAHGMISPGVFIPVAERSGLILPIGEWVIGEACRQARNWQQAGYFTGIISVNVSSIQIARQEVDVVLKKALEETRLSPEYLEIEITESAMMSDPDSAVNLLDKIKAIGVSIALDDFGTGYSSLSYLRHFPIDTLKIDRDFVREIDEKTADAEIVEAITAMAHSLGLRVIAEGIERQSQLDIVLERDCDIYQGFLFSRALTTDEVSALLTRRALKQA